MQHEGILIFIFLALVLLFPIIIFLRVYGVTYSGLRSSGYSRKPAANASQAKKSEQISEQEQQADQNKDVQKTE